MLHQHVRAEQPLDRVSAKVAQREIDGAPEEMGVDLHAVAIRQIAHLLRFLDDDRQVVRQVVPGEAAPVGGMPAEQVGWMERDADAPVCCSVPVADHVQRVGKRLVVGEATAHPLPVLPMGAVPGHGDVRDKGIGRSDPEDDAHAGVGVCPGVLDRVDRVVEPGGS